MSKDNGGSAFPSHGSMGEVVQDGMTLRDYFAANAMQSSVAHWASAGVGIDNDDIRGFTRLSFQIADAMLEARKQ